MLEKWQNTAEDPSAGAILPKPRRSSKNSTTPRILPPEHCQAYAAQQVAKLIVGRRNETLKHGLALRTAVATLSRPAACTSAPPSCRLARAASPHSAPHRSDRRSRSPRIVPPFAGL